MKLPRPAPRYDLHDQSEMRVAIERAIQASHRRNADVEIGAGRLILTSAGGKRFELIVSETGQLSTISV